MKAEEHFNERADLYESMIRKIIPHHDVFFGTALDFVPTGKIDVLELGSGTGLVTEMVLRSNPEARITCIDMSPEMLEVALSKPSLRDVSMLEGDFREVWPEGPFDVVMTTLCLHHLPDDDRMEMLARIHDILSPNGVFINGDVFKPECLWHEEVFRGRWRTAMLSNGLPDTEADGMIAKRENSWEFIDTMRQYRNKLEAAGFQKVLNPLINDFYGVFVGYK
jgi:tRNA (cmo5U34)-methyltransferase